MMPLASFKINALSYFYSCISPSASFIVPLPGTERNYNAIVAILFVLFSYFWNDLLNELCAEHKNARQKHRKQQQ